MAQDKTIKQFSNFSKGMMTESTPLNFPDNFSLDEANMLLNIDGSRERREGLAFESGGAQTATTTTDAAVGMSFYKWEFADDLADNTIGVVQVGQDLYFMDLEQDAPSANLLNGGAPVSLTASMSTSVQTPRLQFAAVNGVLLCTSSDFHYPVKLKYTTGTDSIALTRQDILVRDLWGVDDGTDIDDVNPASTAKHEYNLKNQGWSQTNITAWTPGTPNNAQIMHLGKDSTGAYTQATVEESFFGNSPAPKGRFIINFFDRGTGSAVVPDATYNREAQSGESGLNDDLETGMFSAVASNFGRVFWGGSETDLTDGDDRSPNGSSLILFTQILEREEQLGWCFTEADPSAEVIADQVDSDGGFIQIPELGKVVAMVPLGSQVVVLANNGVWSIVSIDGQFTPTSYQVNKVTSIGVAGADSIVEVEGTVVYWSESGIYQLKLDDISQTAVVQDVTLQTIKTFYNGLTATAKQNAKAYYDSITKQVGWLYQSDPNWDFVNYPDFCDKELVYDLQLQAFTPNVHAPKTIQSPYVVGAVIGENLVSNEEILEVQVGGASVCVNGDQVEQITLSTIQTTSALKYLTYVPNAGFANFTLSNYADNTFHDWTTENYVSFIETGYINFQDFARTKGIPYLIAHFERTEDGFDGNMDALHQSSCFIQARWGWTDSAASNRWSNKFQAYRYRRTYVPTDAADRFDTGHKLITTRNRIRGHGQAVSFLFESEEGKDMKLQGFAITATGNTTV